MKIKEKKHRTVLKMFLGYYMYIIGFNKFMDVIVLYK